MEINMKTKFMMAALCAAMLFPVSSFSQKSSDPEGYLTYCLPKTVLVLEVEAVRENFYAGPYAAYAEKYLGLTVAQDDQQTYQLKTIKMTPYVEPDNSSRYSVNVPKGNLDPSFLKLSATGFISFADAGIAADAQWRFPATAHGDFNDKGISSNLVSESAALYRSNNKSTRFDKLLVQHDVLVEKSLEKKAAEAAQKILDAREERYKIVIGDTDATYSGEALKAAIDELTRIEKEYLTLFVGYKEIETQKAYFEVLPQAGSQQKYIAFRLSDNEGLVPADNLSGKPILMEIVPQEFAPTDVAKAEAEAAAAAQEQLEATGKAPKTKAPAEKRAAQVFFRLPAVCKIVIKNGVETLLQSRVPVYQLGQETSLPVNVVL
jgi:hypothetical protein